MKVCFFDFTTMVGGATKGTVYLLARLKKKEIEVSIIDVYGNCSEYIEDIKKSQIPFTILYPQTENLVIGHLNNKLKRMQVILKQLPSFVKILFKLYCEIKNQKPNYILVNNEKSLFFLTLLKKILDFKIIIYYRGEANSSQMSPRFLNLINKYSDIKYCHSKKAINNMENYGVLGKVHYLPNCIPLLDIKKIAEQRTTSNKNEIKILLSAGRVVEEKGYHTAIEALGILKKQGYDIKLFLPGLVVDQDYLNKLNNLILKYEVNNLVKFLGWVDNIIEILASVDYMVLPSYTEGFPRSIIESMLLKVPVCATPVGGIPEAILHKETGYLFGVNDAHGLANALKTMIDNPLDKEVVVKNAYNFALETFNEDKNTEIFLKNLE